MFRDNIIESLKEMQLYKNVMSSTLNNELYSLHLASEDSFVPQLTIRSIVENNRVPAIAYRFHRDGVNIGNDYFPSRILVDIYKDSCDQNGAVWIPIERMVNCERVYLCIKENGIYDITYQGTLEKCSASITNPDPSLNINAVIANQTSDYWIKVSNICQSHLHRDDLVCIGSKKPLSFSFTGSRTVINCL